MNRMHGTLKPLHCACMVADADCVELLLEKGAEVQHARHHHFDTGVIWVVPMVFWVLFRLLPIGHSQKPYNKL